MSDRTFPTYVLTGYDLELCKHTSFQEQISTKIGAHLFESLKNAKGWSDENYFRQISPHVEASTSRS
ncbi:MAG: hypothetical protein ABJH45_11410 [Paracoccaceae bacterium]